MPSVHSADWYGALTLAERLELLGDDARASRTDGSASLREDLRMQRWRAQFPYLETVLFSDRLKLDGVTEEQFTRVLGAPNELLRERCVTLPSWLAAIDRAFASAAVDAPPARPHRPGGQEVFRMLHVVEPLLLQARSRVERELRAVAEQPGGFPLDPHVVELLLTTLPNRLLWMLGRTLVLELNVARLQKSLAGATPEERFHVFVERLQDRATALGILQEYPVLGRQLVAAIDNWASASVEFVRRLAADWAALRRTFHPAGDPGPLVGLDGNLGDSHRAGRMVLIATFGSGLRLVYKPRALGVDVHFQRLLHWLNERGARPEFRTLSVLDRGDYGWVEFVGAKGCKSQDEVRRFYERQGGYLAILYALEATDFHYENLIADGEHPVLLDLEAFFHPRLGEPDAGNDDEPAVTALMHSVLSVGLLPQRILGKDTSDSIDLSGIGRSDGQITPHQVPRLEMAGTDEMRFARQRVVLTEGRNRPALNGADIDVLDYAGALATGFASTYGLLRQHREDLLGADGPVAAFATDPVRVVLRSTWTYGLLLNEGFHPDVLRDALDRDRLFDRLWVDTKDPVCLKVLRDELADLQNADIPVFTTRPDSCHLWTSSGREITGFFREPGLALARRRIEQLGDDDMQRQLWLIRASLASLAPGLDQAPTIRRPMDRLPEPRAPADRERFLAGARAVGDRLASLALRHRHGASWSDLMLTPGNYWAPAVLGMDLYRGAAGVALFLGYLGSITREERYTDLADAAMRSLRHQLEHSPTQATSIGAFDGWGGILYALTHLAKLWNRPELLAQAEEILTRLPLLIEQDDRLDVIGGAAGCIGGLVVLHRCTGSRGAVDAAIQCGDHLLSTARPMERGFGWPTSDNATPLAGFSHGAAGVAWALLEVAALSGAERFRTAARNAIAYERSLFSAEASNWPDLRAARPPGHGERPPFMTAWCHGAPGIGMARLQALHHLDDRGIRAEIDAAVRATLAGGFGGTHCLCHGDLGNLDLLLQAGHPSSGPLSSRILDSIDQSGWQCAVPLQVEAPGLMLGLAGIGYGLLRLAEPARVPSVLMLEHPR